MDVPQRGRLNMKPALYAILASAILAAACGVAGRPVVAPESDPGASAVCVVLGECTERDIRPAEGFP